MSTRTTGAIALPRSWRAWSPLMLAALATAGLWALSPALGDLQAAIAREQAARSGVGLEYWFGWYGGVSPGSYSLLVPAMSSLVGSMALLCIATLVIAALGYPLSRSASHPAAVSWAIAVAAVLNLFSGRVAFAVGAALTMVALRLAQRRALILGALGLAVAGLASPLAPAFVALVSVAFMVGRNSRTHQTLSIFAGSVAGVSIPFILFGAPGAQGFPWTTLFWVVLIAFGAGLALAGGGAAGWRSPSAWITPVAIVAAAGIFAIPNGVGSNISRFFCLVLPCLVLFFSHRPLKFLILALSPAIIYAGFVAGADQFAAADADSPDVVYAPLVTRLDRVKDLDNHRVELVDTGNHAGSHLLGNSVKLARGWENQSDSRYNPVFYTPGALTGAGYRAWLAENSVAYVAVASKPLRQMRSEAELVGSGLPYLTEIWHNADWKLFAVDAPTPIVEAPLTLVSVTPAQMVIDVPDLNPHTVRIRPNRYLVGRSVGDPMIPACITETPDGWISLRVLTPGRYSLEGSFSVRGVLAEQAPQCVPA